MFDAVVLMTLNWLGCVDYLRDMSRNEIRSSRRVNHLKCKRFHFHLATHMTRRAMRQRGLLFIFKILCFTMFVDRDFA